MILIDRQLEDLCINHKLLDPYDPALLNPASIDVRIGDTLRAESPRGWEEVDLSETTAEDPYWLYPSDFVLVATLETFNMPNNAAGEFRLKSSRAREGYDNALAVFLDPGWHGSKLTLEIVNNLRFHRLPLYKGLKIGQVVLHSCEVPNASYALTGRYNGDRAVAGSKG